jgi:hypothetical protein
MTVQFTPSPKAPIDDNITSSSRFHSVSRLDINPSPSVLLSKRHHFSDGLERSASVSSRLERRQWQDSPSGLPPSRESISGSKRGFPSLPFPTDRPRAESMVGGLYSDQGRRHHQSSLRNLSSIANGENPMRQSRSAITPGDSISAIGTREQPSSSSKNPLDVIRRMEVQRDQHNRVWDVERSATSMGDHTGTAPRPASRYGDQGTPPRMRPTTSMASMRGDYAAPRTAPIDRYSRAIDDSPSSARMGSRLSHVAGPSSEPRQMRCTTSLGGRSSASLDVHSASTEHGRLLFEACRAVELKIPHDLLAANPELIHTLSSTSRSSESVNATLRHAIGLASRIGVDAELDPARLQDDIQHLTLVLREAARTSDQAIRDLTRVMLDLPKTVRGASHRVPTVSSPTASHYTGTDHLKRQTASPDIPRRWQATSPVTQLSDRRSMDQPTRSTTSMVDNQQCGDLTQNRVRTRESLPPNFGIPGRNASLSSFVGRVRNLGASSIRRDGLDTNTNLNTIQASPPSYPPDSEPISPLRSNLPASPDRRQMLRKKASVTSTHTVKANGSFLPPQIVRTTTAVSAITAGIVTSPGMGGYDGMPMTSRLGRGSLEMVHVDGSPGSTGRGSGSFHTAEGGDEEDVRDGEGDTISVVERDLARAARVREEGMVYGEMGKGSSSGLARRATTAGVGEGVARKGSVSERFMATLRRAGN